MRREDKAGFTLLEFSVVAVILSILAAVLLERLVYYQEVAEKINMEATASALRSALRLKVAEYMMAGQKIEYEQLARENPVDWLEIKPPNYAGAFSGSQPDARPSGSWYFDQSGRMLIYQVGHGQNFVPDSLDLRQVRFRLVLSYAETQGGEVLGDSPRQALGIKLETVEPYRWFMP
ncbi:MAG: type II secretion system protein [Sulfuricellaceae bacterium]|nr:type II secretion system protein [Sulfuricellaceae bacterium]